MPPLCSITAEEGRLVTTVLEIAGFSLMLLSAMVLVFRLRRPRPPIRRVVWQPGTTACFAAVGHGVFCDVDCLLTSCDWGSILEGPGELIWFFFETPLRQYAYVIPVVWMLQALGRRWGPEPGWIDGSGRLLGLAWIAWAIAGVFRP